MQSSNEDVNEKKHGTLEEEHLQHGNIQKTLPYRIRKDTAFRNKLRRSAAVTYDMFVVGWLKGIIGPSFPEILYLTDTSLQQGSAYLTVLYACKIIGHAFAGLVYDRMDRDLYSAILAVVNALVLIVLPWCRVYPIMIMMYGLHGLVISALELGLITESVNLWNKEARQIYLQFTTFIFAISTIVSPLAIIPFLMTNLKTVAGNINKGIEIRNLRNAADEFNRSETQYIFDTTSMSFTTNIDNQTFSNISISSTALNDQHSVLYIAFMLAAFLVISGGIPFACFYFSKKSPAKLPKRQKDDISNDISLLSNLGEGQKADCSCHHTKETKSDAENHDLFPESTHEEVDRALSKTGGNLLFSWASVCSQPLFIFMFIIICVFGALHSGLEIAMSDLMPTLCQQFLNWPASQAAITVSLLYLFLTLGRITCAFLLKVISLTKIIGIFVLFIIAGSAVLSMSTTFNSTPGTWISIGIIGLGISACYPSQLGWTSQYLVPLTGKLTATLLCTMYIGSVVAPPVFSFFMSNYSHLFFCYGMLFMSGVAFICVVFMAIYVYRLEKKNNITT
ncbi:uncharacterized protein LOC132565511 [Ylistrum balloti]|uniref:uncharacterized protein LOC132565511 n=1 Tax=Ylistrum balloti TaxID=509963 RepID=UPI002905B5FC|nr:uncharacterized protein LOC132565511 [Ylistrum balloti]